MPNFAGTKRKFYNIWNNSEKNRIQIIRNEFNQSLQLRNISYTEPSNSLVRRILDLSTSWGNFNLITNPNDNEEVWTAYANYEVELIGVNENLINSIVIEPIIRFGSGSISIVDELSTDNTIYRNSIIEVEDLVGTTNKILRFNEGIFIEDTNDIEEAQNGLQIMLNVKMANPNLIL